MIPNAERYLNRLEHRIDRIKHDPLEKKPGLNDTIALKEYQKKQARERVAHDIQRIKAEIEPVNE